MKLAVLDRDGGRCYLCGNLGADTADHVLALARGGADTLDNQRAAHSLCNLKKSGFVDNRDGDRNRWPRFPEAHPGAAQS